MKLLRSRVAVKDEKEAPKLFQKETHKEKYHRYLKSKKWQSFKNRVKAQRNHKCEVCGISGFKTALHVHHLTYERVFDENPIDVQVLCVDCHQKEHGIK